MHARVSTYEGSADRLDEGIRGFERTTDALRQLDGFEGAYLLVDRAAGRALSVTLWSSEEAVQASAERANQMRSEATSPAGITIESVDTYEVAMQVEASAGTGPGAGPAG